MKQTNRKSTFTKLALLLIASFLSLNLVKAQDEYLSLVIDVDCVSETVNLSSQVLYASLQSEKPNSSKEQPAEIEDWMYDLKLWVNSEDEPEAEIEDWMFNINLWNDKLADNEEVEMEIEDWMLNADFWTNNIAENELEIEDWMYDSNFWN